MRARTPRAPQPVRHPQRLGVDARAQRLDAGQIVVEGLLGADALGVAIGDHRARIDRLRALPQIAAAGAEPLLQKRQPLADQIADGGDPHGVEDLRALGADARQPRHRQRRQKSRAPVGRHLQLAVRLGQIGRDLGDQLDRRDPGRGRQPQLVGDAAPQPAGDLGRRPEQAARGGDVEKSLVERQRLVKRRHGLQDVEHPAADVGVDVEAGAHHHGVGRQAQRARHRHRAPHAERADLVGGRQHDATLGVTTDDQRPPAQGGSSRCSTDA